MATRNLECQIAQLQIGRYLAGDPLSAEALISLEGHISECPGCAAELRLRKMSLQLPVAEPEATKVSPVAVPDPTPAASGPRLLDLLREKSNPGPVGIPTHALIEVPEPALPDPEPVAERRELSPAVRRAIAYGLGLVAVLLFMSTIGRDPTRYLGQRATAALPATTPQNGSTSVSDPETLAPAPTPTATPNSPAEKSAEVTPAAPEATDENWTLTDVLPMMFADPMRTFGGEPNEIQATLDATQTMLEKMTEPAVVASSVAPEARRPVTRRRPTRRTTAARPRPQNRIARIDPAPAPITIFPPEGNP